MRILGISAFYHDSAACLVRDGKVVAAAQEERFTRRKHDARFPSNAIRYCLLHEGIDIADLDYVVFYEKPFLKFERLLETYIAFAPSGLRSFQKAMPLWLREKLFQRSDLRKNLDGVDDGKLLFCEHHLSHAASAFFASPFDQAAILTIDGVGEWTTTSTGTGTANKIEITKEIQFPHSLGLLYSAFTQYLGFRVNSGEYKMMGLAPYGQARYAQQILDTLIDLKPDGSFRLNLEYFDYCTGLSMINRKFEALFGGPCRQADESLTQHHMDLAASIQSVLEEAVLRITRVLAAETRIPNLCMAGGVALNCAANAKILRDAKFSAVWVQPAAGDAGGAVGAALAAYHLHGGAPRSQHAMTDAYLGPAWSNDEIKQRLAQAGAVFHSFNEERMIDETVNALLEQKAVGWFQGRMEFGPRALGARSILADPRSPHMRARLNEKIKRREPFRPFAPAVLREHLSTSFDLAIDSPYMSFLATGRRADIPAVTHVDGSARVQTVHRETNPLFHALLSAFHARTGCPVLVNTSFNVRGEPIVCTPDEAFRCFMGTELDALAIGNCFLNKSSQRPDLKWDSSIAAELD